MINEKNKKLRFAHEMYEKGEITEKQLYDTYYDLYLGKKENTK